MTKEEIKKALECCEKYAYCKDCPCYTYCEHELHKGALALITEQEKEIERLKANDEEACLKCIESKHATAEEYAKQFRNRIISINEKEIKQAKIEVLNELKERIKTAIDTYWNSNGGGYYLAEDAIGDIDDLIEEVENEQKD